MQETDQLVEYSSLDWGTRELTLTNIKKIQPKSYSRIGGDLESLV